jgi:hypothetical protein
LGIEKAPRESARGFRVDTDHGVIVVEFSRLAIGCLSAECQIGFFYVLG